MKKTILILVFATITLFQGACDRDSASKANEHGEQAHGEAHGDRHDGQEQKRNDAEHAEDTVRISRSAIERAEIRIEQVKAEVLSGGLAVPAEVQLDPDRSAHISPIVEGQVVKVHVSLGEHVKKGDPLVVLSSVALGETSASLAEAQAQLSVAKANYQRQKELTESKIGAKRNLIEAQGALEEARARLSGLRSRARVYGGGGTGAKTTIRSPIAGEIIKRHATVGEVVSPGTVLLQIASLDRVWIMGRVYAQDVAAVRANAPVTLALRSVPGRTWKGTLDYVAPALDEKTRTLTVRAIFDNEDSALRPGLFGTLRMMSPDSTPVPTIAESALQELRGQTVVFVPVGDEGEFHAVPVAVAHRMSGRAAIADGLAAGDRYVATGAFVLKSQMLRSELGEGHEH